MATFLRIHLVVMVVVTQMIHLHTPALSATGLDKSEDEVLAVEKRRVEALTHNDIAALERILSDDLLYTHSSGVTETKAEYVGQLKAGTLKYVSVEHRETRVRLYGSTALLSGKTRIKAVARGQELNNDLTFLIVYVRQRGAWRMVSWQSTRITQ
ncbi:MAG TPA: nuclear transport factor 2 family protein [Blastocatellia bacterium]|nr:nuclear transport factor 2 family protein [Blastocatellia bacterium]